MIGSGMPNTALDVQDYSQYTAPQLEGVVAMIGITERGAVCVPQLVRTWIEYKKYFGGFVSYSKFPLLCWRALNAGTPLLISRVAHFDDLAILASPDGTKGTATLTVSSNSTVFTAKNIGPWSSGLTVTVAAAANGIANEVDITVALAGYPELTQVIRNVDNTPSASQKTTFNAQCRLVDMGTVTNLIPVGSVTLAAGTYPIVDLAATDYIGDATGTTGIHSFDGNTSAVRICAPEMSATTFEVALKNYVEARQDMRAILFVPQGLDATDALDFRKKTGAYAGGTLIDSWYCSLEWSDITVVDQLDQNNVNIPIVADVLGLKGYRDNNSKPWYASAGRELGIIKDTSGLVYNVGTPSRRTEADDLTNNGVNYAIEHPQWGTVHWGNRTLQRETSLLQKENVAELLIYLLRSLKPNFDEALFTPNDPTTWKKIYRKNKKILDRVRDERGLSRYEYKGDQDVDLSVQAVINSQEDIAAGIYKVIIDLYPIPGLEYAGLTLTVNVDSTAGAVVANVN